ncbi:MAG: hypothetical protein GC129_07405 [Proteobacteria bacterium]|nr:hypothetical protein [Pseudomonadota bacterium]
MATTYPAAWIDNDGSWRLFTGFALLLIIIPAFFTASYIGRYDLPIWYLVPFVAAMLLLGWLNYRHIQHKHRRRQAWARLVAGRPWLNEAVSLDLREKEFEAWHAGKNDLANAYRQMRENLNALVGEVNVAAGPDVDDVSKQPFIRDTLSFLQRLARNCELAEGTTG